MWGVELTIFYFLAFAAFIIPFHTVIDIIVLNVQELYGGFKIYSYLEYLGDRFRTRDEAWVMHSKHVDLAVSNSNRTIDLSCFSSQYYFLIMMHSFSLVLAALAVEGMLQNNYNVFDDMWTPALAYILFKVFTISHGYLVGFGKALGVWKQLEERYRVAPEDSRQVLPDADLVPRWTDDYRAIVETIQTDKFINPARMVNDMFRHRFVKHNRPWIMSQIHGIFEIKFIDKVGKEAGGGKAKGRGIVLRQLARLLRNKGEMSISSDDSEDEDRKPVFYLLLNHCQSLFLFE